MPIPGYLIHTHRRLPSGPKTSLSGDWLSDTPDPLIGRGGFELELT